MSVFYNFYPAPGDLMVCLCDDRVVVPGYRWVLKGEACVYASSTGGLWMPAGLWRFVLVLKDGMFTVETLAFSPDDIAELFKNVGVAHDSR